MLVSDFDFFCSSLLNLSSHCCNQKYKGMTFESFAVVCRQTCGLHPPEEHEVLEMEIVQNN